MYCEKCGSEIKQGQSFCQECGAPVSVGQNEQRESAIFDTSNEKRMTMISGAKPSDIILAVCYLLLLLHWGGGGIIHLIHGIRQVSYINGFLKVVGMLIYLLPAIVGTLLSLSGLKELKRRIYHIGIGVLIMSILLICQVVKTILFQFNVNNFGLFVRWTFGVYSSGFWVLFIVCIAIIVFCHMKKTEI